MALGIHVATINILNFERDWHRRLDLLRSATAALKPDILALQEVVYPMDQERAIVGGRPGTYTVVRGWDEQPELGNSVLVRRPTAVVSSTRRDVRRGCSALRVDLRTDDGRAISVTTTHLYWPEKAQRKRARQGERVLRLIDRAPARDGEILLGDFNADAWEPVVKLIESAGFRSAHRLANGTEPAVTYPTPLLTGADRPKRDRCVDYVFVRGPLSVAACRLAYDQPSPEDSALFPSDHFGLVADLVPA